MTDPDDGLSPDELKLAAHACEIAAFQPSANYELLLLIQRKLTQEAERRHELLKEIAGNCDV